MPSEPSEVILRFVELHPGQYTISRLAHQLAKLEPSASVEDYRAEIRAMMGSELTLFDRMVAPR